MLFLCRLKSLYGRLFITLQNVRQGLVMQTMASLMA